MLLNLQDRATRRSLPVVRGDVLHLSLLRERHETTFRQQNVDFVRGTTEAGTGDGYF